MHFWDNSKTLESIDKSKSVDSTINTMMPPFLNRSISWIFQSISYGVSTHIFMVTDQWKSIKSKASECNQRSQTVRLISAGYAPIGWWLKHPKEKQKTHSLHLNEFRSKHGKFVFPSYLGPLELNNFDVIWRDFLTLGYRGILRLFHK